MKEGGTLAKVLYGIGVLLLIKRLKSVYPDVPQPWYSDDEGSLGTYDKIELYFNMLKQFVPSGGYCPKPSKRVLIVHPDNIESRKLFGFRHGFNVFTGARYPGSFIGVDDSKCDWLQYCTLKWGGNSHNQQNSG